MQPSRDAVVATTHRVIGTAAIRKPAPYALTEPLIRMAAVSCPVRPQRHRTKVGTRGADLSIISREQATLSNTSSKPVTRRRPPAQPVVLNLSQIPPIVDSNRFAC